MNESISERIARRTMDKATWPDGPWKSEPDQKQWTDKDTGLECMIVRGPVGALCGYVGVPEGHPAYGKSYYSSDLSLDDVLSGKADMAAAAVQKQINDISVHGGLTFAREGGEFWPKPFYWFGFDCAHSGDFCPKMDDIEKLGRDTGWGEKETYRDLKYVMSEVASLARQLSSIKRSIKD